MARRPSRLVKVTVKMRYADRGRSRRGIALVGSRRFGTFRRRTGQVAIGTLERAKAIGPNRTGKRSIS